MDEHDGQKENNALGKGNSILEKYSKGEGNKMNQLLTNIYIFCVNDQFREKRLNYYRTELNAVFSFSTNESIGRGKAHKISN